MKFRPFAEAREFAHSLYLKSSTEWREYCKSGNKPHNIPRVPYKVYLDEWKGWGDWLGTGAISTHDRKYRSFEDARKFVHSLVLKNNREWRKYCISGNKPHNIPADPDRTYKDEWKGWGDWLGTGTISSRNRQYRSFIDARNFVHTLGLVSILEWKEYCKSGKKPINIPSKPFIIYKSEWKRWRDWLGISQFKRRQYKSFEDARKYAHSLRLKTQKEWQNFSKSGKRHVDIPSNPSEVYKDEWKGWGDWLGYRCHCFTGHSIPLFRPCKQLCS